MKIKQCNRNPYFLADFAYDGEFSDGNKFYLRIPEKDVEEFATKLLEEKISAEFPYIDENY